MMLLSVVSTLGLALLSVASAEDDNKVNLRGGSDVVVDEPRLLAGSRLDQQDEPRDLSSSSSQQCTLRLHENPVDVKSWNQASAFCKRQGGAGSRLATLGEYCPLGRNNDPIFGKKSGDQWVAYHDDKNGWVNVGTWGDDKETCVTHLEGTLTYPSWGVDASSKKEEESNFLYCYECPGTCSFKLHTSPSGVNNWDQAKSYCKNQGTTGSRLATFDEYCPGGVNSDSAIGSQEGDQWVAMDDYKNGWVQVGRGSGPMHGRQTCVTYMDRVGDNPAWGVDDVKAADESNLLYCFECSGTVEHSDTCPAGYQDNGATTTCTSGWSHGCDEGCRRSECANNGGFWADLDPGSNPYACHMLGTWCPSGWTATQQYGKTCTKSYSSNCQEECARNLCQSRGGIFPKLDFSHNAYTCFAPYNPATKETTKMFPENTIPMKLAEMTFDSARVSKTAFYSTIVSGKNEYFRRREGFDSFDVWLTETRPGQSIVAKSNGVCYGVFAPSWATNLNLNNVEFHAHAKKCWAREGFYQGYVNEYREAFDAKIDSCLKTCGDSECPLVLTGMSQGGATAVVAAAYWKHKKPIVITFGAPRVVQDCDLLDDSRHYRWVTTAPIPFHHMGYDIVVNGPGFGAPHHGRPFLLANDLTYNDQPVMLPFNDNLDLDPAAYSIHTTDGYLRQVTSIRTHALISGPLNTDGWRPGAACREHYHCASNNCDNWYCA